ncbi:MAG TPA: CDP-alcohol phosphatidyltransferase family protein [Dehalococcoidia bacterium]|nr:CDP-alcohol phosphatidyltransferase family protein [Dehalococcoidia bacterium]
MPALTPRSAPKWLVDPAVGALSRIGITPNMLTVFGFAGNVGAAVLAAHGEFLLAGVAMLFFSALDFLDGSLARATGRATPFGSVFDASLDRLSEAAVLFGLLWYFTDNNARAESLACFAAVVASFMVSYLRARAEVIGVKMREGVFTRTERVILLGGALVVQDIVDENILKWVLYALTAIAGFTVLQRLVIVWEKTKGQVDPPQDTK